MSSIRIIKIYWRTFHSIETIKVTLGSSPTDNEITSTREEFPEEDEVYDHKTTSKRTINKDGSHTIKIHYSLEDNPDWPEDTIGPGTTIITVAQDLNSAKAMWNSEYNKEYDGEGKCYVFTEELCKEHGLEVISRRKRDQIRFKEIILEKDGSCCAITGEKTKSVLEAAHIIPVWAKGNELPENGLILRADIHRLYDADLFKIKDNGSIEITGQLSDHYRSILKGSKISGRILKRIKKALQEKSELIQSQ